MPTNDFSPLQPFLPARAGSSKLLQRCLDLRPRFPEQAGPTTAIPFDPRSREIERLKLYQPRAAAERAAVWLDETFFAARDAPDDQEAVGLFCSALSTWGALQRNLGQLGDASLALHHALSVLEPVPCSTRMGFALNRAAYVLADLGHTEDGLAAMQQAVSTHEATPGGEHNAGIALIGLGAFELFYRRETTLGRQALSAAMQKLPPEDELMRVCAGHGIAYSDLMDQQTNRALESLLALEDRHPRMAPHLRLRCRWLKAEIAAAAGEHDLAIAFYETLLPQVVEVAEPDGAVLVIFDWARVLLEHEDRRDDLRAIHARLEPLVDQLSRPELLALEPFRDALEAGELDAPLLDGTAVAFKSATNRMALGMGRPGGAGKPERVGHAA